MITGLWDTETGGDLTVSRRRRVDPSDTQAGLTPGADREGLCSLRRRVRLKCCKILALLAAISLLALAACTGCEQAMGEQAAREPDGARDVRAEARVDGEGGVVARAGDGAVARAGGAEARAGDAIAKAESRAESRIESSGDGGRVREATLEFQGDPETAFSGTCTIGDEEREVSGQVPGHFVFKLDGQKLECEIHKQSTGAMNIVLDAGGAENMQLTNSQLATVRIAYSGEGYSSSIQSSDGSSRQIINSHSSSIVSSSSTRTR